MIEIHVKRIPFVIAFYLAYRVCSIDRFPVPDIIVLVAAYASVADQ
jgi:hypothetical protein